MQTLKETPTLPICACFPQILTTVETNAVTILTAETGAGKSTQVPQLLLGAGYDVVVTQPRRLATRTVAGRVAKEFGSPLGGVVGFQTAEEERRSRETRCLFVTDGLALSRQLKGPGQSVLVIDEAHEWNLNIETLVALVKRQIKNNPDFRVVLMSATLEAQRLSAYFGGAPVIEVPGRTFPVEESDSITASMTGDIALLAQQGRNVLVFQPGKREIDDTVAALNAMKLDAEILPLHGGQTSEEQDRCFQRYGRPKIIVATNVAQTSITIDDIDAVVDGGMERRVGFVNGVEGLFLGPISWADREQRKGRAGRTKPGVYIDWSQRDRNQRPAFPVAEILRAPLERVVLQLAEAHLDMEELEFFHQPKLSDIQAAKRVLHALGCMKNGKMTDIGRRVAKLPVSPRYGRMIVEASGLGVVDDVLTLVAILEQGGEIVHRTCPSCRRMGIKSCTCWQRLVPNETTSDVLAQLAMYRKAETMSSREKGAVGISKAFGSARKLRTRLAKALQDKVDLSSSGKRDDILRAVCAGMVDYLYQRDGYYRYVNGNGHIRELSHSSVVKNPDWVVAQPWDLEVPRTYGTYTLELLRLASEVDPMWLANIAPHLVELKEGLSPSYDTKYDEVVSITEVYFNGQCIRTFTEADPTHPEAERLRREGRNEAKWTHWDRPKIALPDLTDVASVMPDITVCPYGVDSETGESLLAYGTVASDYNYDRGEWEFSSLWTRDRHLAEVTHRISVRGLKNHQNQLEKYIKRQHRMERAQKLSDQLDELHQEHGCNLDLSGELRRQLEIVTRPSEWSHEEYFKEVEALIAEVIAEVGRLAELEQRNEVNDTELADLAAHFNRH